MKKLNLDIQRFSATNSTTNYELPQFVGTDKPSWLTDFNSAMGAIDTGMATNASDIDDLESDVATASATASQASSDVSTLTSTVSTLSTNVTTATNTANNAQSTATSALNTANTANGKADTNATNITALSGRVTQTEADIDKFNLTDIKDTTFTITGGANSANSIKVATNSDGSIGKVYGRIQFTKTSANTQFSCSSDLRPEEEITINALGMAYFRKGTSANFSVWGIENITVATNGTISFNLNISTGTADNGMIVFYPCLLFMSNFGDTPEE